MKRFTDCENSAYAVATLVKLNADLYIDTAISRATQRAICHERWIRAIRRVAALEVLVDGILSAEKASPFLSV